MKFPLPQTSYYSSYKGYWKGKKMYCLLNHVNFSARFSDSNENSSSVKWFSHSINNKINLNCPFSIFLSIFKGISFGLAKPNTGYL